MNTELENKIVRFSESVSKTNNPKLVEFWNEIIDDLNNEFYSDKVASQNDINDFQVYKLTEKISKLQVFILMTLRNRFDNRNRFIQNYNIINEFSDNKIYDELKGKALIYELKNEKPFIKVEGLKRHKIRKSLSIKQALVC